MEYRHHCEEGLATANRAVGRVRPAVRPALALPEAVVALQRLAGNRAVTSALTAGPIPVQRHDLKPPKKHAHKDEIESAATKVGNGWSEALVEGIDVLTESSDAGAIQARIAQLDAFLTPVQHLFDLFGIATSDALSSVSKLKSDWSGKRDKARGAKDKLVPRAETLALGRAKTKGTNPLVRIEALLVDVCTAIEKAGTDAGRLADLRRFVQFRALTAEDLVRTLEAVAKAESGHLQATRWIMAQLKAARSALDGITELGKKLDDLTTARVAVVAARQRVASDRAAQVAADQKRLELAHSEVEFLEAFSAQLALDAEAWLEHPNADPGSIATAQHSVATRLAVARQAVVSTNLALQQSQAATVAPVETEPAVVGAELGVTTAEQSLTGTAATTKTAVETEQKMRAIAGDEQSLQDLRNLIPDDGLLTVAVGLGPKLMGLLRDNRVGPQKVIALAQLVDLTAMTALAAAGDELYTLLRGLPAQEIEALVHEPSIGPSKVVELIRALKPPEIQRLVQVLGLAELGDILGQMSADELKASNLDATVLKDLKKKFTSADVGHMHRGLGAGGLSAMLDECSVTELTAIRTKVGADRLSVLVGTWKLGKKALEKYSADFLKNFAGIDDSVMQHLLDIQYKDGPLRIVGGHDKQTFKDFLANAGNFPGGVSGQITHTDFAEGDVSKVRYRITVNGQLGSGSKTLINNLTGNLSFWRLRANEAIWQSVRDGAYVEGHNQWRGTDTLKLTWEGYKNGHVVTTAFPV